MIWASRQGVTPRCAPPRAAIVVLLDTSIELSGDIWTPLGRRCRPILGVGVVGPYGLVPPILKEFRETRRARTSMPIEGYLLAFRARAAVVRSGRLEERFRFYRLLDIYMSFFVQDRRLSRGAYAGGGGALGKHPHREWFSLTDEERATKSKQNYDLFRRRWHHGESLLTANYVAATSWRGHDHPHHVDGAHTHAPRSCRRPGPHRHDHRTGPTIRTPTRTTHERAPAGAGDGRGTDAAVGG